MQDPHVNPATGVWDDNYYAQTYGNQGGGGGGYGFSLPNIPPFKFDYDQANKEALAKLEPYYKQKLAEAEGDVERAKRLIEEDYARGKRYRAEDETEQLSEDTRTAQEEVRDTRENLNKRGLLFGQQTDQMNPQAPISQFAQQMELNPLTDKQQARRLAIQRAIQRQEEVAGIERKRGLEEQDIALPRARRDLEEEKQMRARTEFVPEAYNRALQKHNESYGASLNPYLQRG